VRQQVKIKVRPDQIVRFPGICVHCAQPADAQKQAHLLVKKRTGRVTRLVDVPLCARCSQATQHLSGEEERLQKLTRVMLGAAFFLSLALVLLLLPAGLALGLRLIVATAVSTAVSAILFSYGRQAVRRAALPEKQAILSAAHITAFSWRATTFEFTNETFARRFAELNQSLLMDYKT
jgi:hypothetical protein